MGWLEDDAMERWWEIDAKPNEGWIDRQLKKRKKDFLLSVCLSVCRSYRSMRAPARATDARARSTSDFIDSIEWINQIEWKFCCFCFVCLFASHEITVQYRTYTHDAQERTNEHTRSTQTTKATTILRSSKYYYYFLLLLLMIIGNSSSFSAFSYSFDLFSREWSDPPCVSCALPHRSRLWQIIIIVGE